MVRLSVRDYKYEYLGYGWAVSTLSVLCWLSSLLLFEEFTLKGYYRSTSEEYDSVY